MIRCSVAASTAALLLAGARAQQHLELQDLVKQANLAFVGKVIAVANEPVPDKGMAFTHVTVAIERRLFDRTGQKPEPTIELVFAGGQLGDREVRVSGVPTFAVGEEVGMFVLHDGNRYQSPIVGGNQGLVRIARDEVSDARHPLLEGRRGIVAIQKGSIVAADAVRSIRNGEVRWVERQPMPGEDRVGAPTPVSGSGAVQATTSTPPPRPQHLLDLDGFCAGVIACDEAIPAPAKAGGGK